MDRRIAIRRRSVRGRTGTGRQQEGARHQWQGSQGEGSEHGWGKLAFLKISRPSITTGSRKDVSMWLVGLELGIVAVLLAIVGLALRAPKNKDTDAPPND